MKVNNKAINNVIASGTDNVIIPTESQNRLGIGYKSNINSNIPNGFFYSLSEAIQFLQFTVGLYDASAEYEEGNICKLLYKDNAGYQLKSFRRTNKNNTIKKGNAPYKPATIETTNGIDCYSNGTENGDWEEIKSGLSAYLFQIEGKTIDDLLNNNYTKENINTFLSKEKFNELYKVCNDFTQIYFLDCLISYKKIGTYTTGSQGTGDLKNYKSLSLTIAVGNLKNTENRDGTITLYFDYNITDDTYSNFYINGLLVKGKELLEFSKSSLTGWSKIQKTVLRDIVFGNSDPNTFKDGISLPTTKGTNGGDDYTAWKQEVDLLDMLSKQLGIDKSKLNIVDWNFQPYKHDKYAIGEVVKGTLAVQNSPPFMLLYPFPAMFCVQFKDNTQEQQGLTANVYFQLCDENYPDCPEEILSNFYGWYAAMQYSAGVSEIRHPGGVDSTGSSKVISSYIDAYCYGYGQELSNNIDYRYSVTGNAIYDINTHIFTGNKLKFGIYSDTTGLQRAGYIRLNIDMRYQVMGG